jgi:hypothetical protein
VDFWRLWDVLANVDRDLVASDKDDEEPYNTASNAGGGALADVLLREEGRLGGPAGRGLSAQHRARFELLATKPGSIGLHARVMFVVHLQWLHAVDPGWTEVYLLPRFAWDWPDQDETIRFWRTFAFDLRSGPSLFAKLAPSYLESLRLRKKLGNQAYHSLCHEFGDVIVEMPSMFDHAQTVAALHDVGPEGCAEILEALQHKLRAVGNSAASLWQERIAPWLREHWPVNHELRSGRVAHEAIEVAFLTRDAFPEAASLIDKKFSIEDVDEDVIWMFRLHNESNYQDYDYLANHSIEVGRLLSRGLSKKATDFAAHDMRQIVGRLKRLHSGVPEGWNLLFERYGKR